MSPPRLGLLLAGLAAAQSSDQPSRGRWLPTGGESIESPPPYALGHRGHGANNGGDPSHPIENTLDAFQAAFGAGVRVVELDLRRTADGKVVVFHDGVLEDRTCVSALTYAELRGRRPYVLLFRTVLHSSREFGTYGPGRHLSVLGRNLRPGGYVPGLSHPLAQARANVAVTR